MKTERNEEPGLLDLLLRLLVIASLISYVLILLGALVGEARAEDDGGGTTSVASGQVRDGHSMPGERSGDGTGEVGATSYGGVGGYGTGSNGGADYGVDQASIGGGGEGLSGLSPSTHVTEYHYLAIGGGATKSWDTQNTDEWEYGNEYGYSLDISYGYAARLPGQGNWVLGGEGELLYSPKNLHGYNPGGKKGHSADGQVNEAGAALINGRVGYDLVDAMPYLVGGGGLGLSSKEGGVVAWQVGTGVIVPVSARFAVDAGYRYVNIGEMDLSTYRVGLQVRF